MPPPPTRFAKYSSTSAPVTTSTVDVSEKGLPVSLVSMRASSSLRARKREAARWRMRARSIGGVEDQVGKARCAEAMAASMPAFEVVWMFATGWAVAGSMVWKVEVDEPDWSLPS